MNLNPISMLVILIFVALGPARAQDGIHPEGRPDAGAIVFKKCMACHQVGPNAQNGIAPVLNGVVNRAAGRYPNYNYSSANKNSGLVWDAQTLANYLRAPAKLVPGTKMIFSGLKKDQEISDVIAYLKQFAADGKTDQLVDHCAAVRSNAPLVSCSLKIPPGSKNERVQH